jgi:hypothetical protein
MPGRPDCVIGAGIRRGKIKPDDDGGESGRSVRRWPGPPTAMEGQDAKQEEEFAKICEALEMF